MTDEELFNQLNTIANELRDLSPSKTPSQKLQELEELLNMLYQRFSNEVDSIDLEKAILEVLGLVAYLNDINSRSINQPRPPDFFISLKKTSRLLTIILFFLKKP